MIIKFDLDFKEFKVTILSLIQFLTYAEGSRPSKSSSIYEHYTLVIVIGVDADKS